MTSKIWSFILALLLVFGVSGCYIKQVRHLSSDVALLKVGVSTKEDVVVFLGEPDDQVVVGEGVEKWLYRDQHSSFMEKTPLVGKHIGSPAIHQVVVTLRNGIVAECIYSLTDADDLNWAKDFSWQEK